MENKIFQKVKSQRAFSIIELIMTIVIIGILAAVAVPAFINMRRDAANAAAEANVGALRSAAGIYYAKTAIDANQCLCVVNGATYNGIVGCNAYGRLVSVDAPCFPASTAELEAQLNSALTWSGNGTAACYNATTGNTIAC